MNRTVFGHLSVRSCGEPGYRVGPHVTKTFQGKTQVQMLDLPPLTLGVTLDRTFPDLSWVQGWWVDGSAGS